MKYYAAMYVDGSVDTPKFWAQTNLEPQSYHELKVGYHQLPSTRVIVFCLFSFLFVSEWKSSKNLSMFSPVNS